MTMHTFKKAAVAASALVASGIASAQVTLPSTGVAVDDHITAAITGMGSVAAVAVGGFFAFLIVRKALGWGRKAL